MPTVGLVHLSESTKRRIELAEPWDREAGEKLQPIRSGGGGGGGGPASSSWEGSEEPTGSSGKRTKKRKKVVKGKLSLAEEGGRDDGTDDGGYSSSTDPTRANSEDNNQSGEEDEVKKRKVNPKLRLPAPERLMKNTLLKAQERETLRREFLALQEGIKNEKISIPFIFYDGRCRACSNF